MKEELLSKLEELNFPFEIKNGCANCWGDLHKGCDEDCGQRLPLNVSHVLQALGNDFGYLSQPHENDWRANSDGSHEDCEGKNALEALVKLWIFLHEKA